MVAEVHPPGTEPANSANRSRIESLDLVKGFAILCVIQTHTVFWSGAIYLPDWTRRLALVVDVPVFFFISGFLLASGPSRGIPWRALRQLRGILVPYFILGTIALVFSTIAKLVAHGSNTLESLGRSALTFLWMSPSGPAWEMWIVLTGSLWFFRAYLEALPFVVLILATPLRRWLPLWTCLVLAFLATRGTSFVPVGRPVETDSLRVTAGALAVILLGASFRDRLWQGWTLRSSFLLTALWALSLAAIAILLPVGEACNLGYSKFPPTWTYLLVNMFLVLSLLALAVVERDRGLGLVPAPIRRMLGWCGRNTFEIFLVQGMVTSVPLHFVSQFLQRGWSPSALYLLTFSWNLAGTLGGVAALRAVGRGWERARSRRLESGAGIAAERDLGLR